MKYAIPIITLITALGLSVASAYMSVMGLMFLFSGIIAPFILIEIGKVVSTIILHKHWNHKFGLVKLGLVVTVILSMLVTSIGVFGYLSKASTEGKQDVTINSSKLESLEQSIERKESSLSRNTLQIDKYNDMLGRLITDNPTKAQRERRNIQASIKELEKENKNISQELDKLHDEIIPYKKEISKHEVEIGPLLYITRLIYGEEYKKHAEEALTYLIVTFMFILDPFAVMLLIASQKSFHKISGRGRKVRINTKKNEPVPEPVIDEFGIPIQEEVPELSVADIPTRATRQRRGTNIV